MQSLALAQIGTQLTNQVCAARPELNGHAGDLIAWLVLAVLASPSFHRADLARPGYDALLAELVATVLDAPIRPDFPAPEAATSSQLRSEALLDAAAGMFARYGYTEVGIENSGAVVGITGASVYNHFASKLDMLLTALRRAADALRMDLSATYASVSTATGALRELVRSYVGFAYQHSDLVDLLVTESQRLPANERLHGRQAQHDYLNEWVNLITVAYPEVNPAAAKIRVQAVLTVANSAARTPRLVRNPTGAAAVETVCTRLLSLPS